MIRVAHAAGNWPDRPNARHHPGRRGPVRAAVYRGALRGQVQATILGSPRDPRLALPSRLPGHVYAI